MLGLRFSCCEEILDLLQKWHSQDTSHSPEKKKKRINPIVFIPWGSNLISKHCTERWILSPLCALTALLWAPAERGKSQGWKSTFCEQEMPCLPLQPSRDSRDTAGTTAQSITLFLRSGTGGSEAWDYPTALMFFRLCGNFRDVLLNHNRMKSVF